MILSHDQIRAINICPDCSRRDVKIFTCSTHEDMHEAEVPCFLMTWAPFNAVQVLHDSGCPRLIQVSPREYFSEETFIQPLDLPDDHPWIEKLATLEEK